MQIQTPPQHNKKGTVLDRRNSLRRLLFAAVAAIALCSPLHAVEWAYFATVSDTLGINTGRVCVGDASKGDIGCPTYAPTVSSAGLLTATTGSFGGLTVTGSVSATNISASALTVNGVAITGDGGGGMGAVNFIDAADLTGAGYSSASSGTLTANNNNACSYGPEMSGDFVTNVTIGAFSGADWWFGVFDSSETGTFSNSHESGNMGNMTNSFFLGSYSGYGLSKGGTMLSSGTFMAQGSTYQLVRTSGAIALKTNGSTTYTYSGTYDNTMRVAFCHSNGNSGQTVTNAYVQSGGNGGSGGTPGGSDTQIQFNNSSAFDGSANFTWANSLNRLTATNISATNISTTRIDTANHLNFGTGLYSTGLSSFYVANNIGTGNPGINFDATDFIDYDRTNNLMRFQIGSVRAVIESTGDVGIGTTNPNAKLDVYGTISASALTVGGVAITGGSGSGDWYGIASIPTQVQAVSNSGNITLGTLTASTASATAVTAQTVRLSQSSAACSSASDHGTLRRDPSSGRLQICMDR